MNCSDLYLTDEKKITYMLDFDKLLSMTNSEFWGIDNGIREILITINNSRSYQTLYSKKYEIDPYNWNLEATSYLEITATEDSWIKLSDILQNIKHCVTCSNSLVEINEYAPHENYNLHGNLVIDIGCIKDPNHFRIKYFRIAIESFDVNCHDKFWDCIATNFQNRF